MYYTDFMVDRAQHMRPLEYDLSENHNLLVRYLHDMGVLDNVPVGTLGPAEILTASDALAAPLRSLVVGGNSTQDGTPTPDAPVDIRSVVEPVVTFAGRNLFDKSDITPNRYINASGGLSAWNAASASDYIPVVPNTSYTLHFGESPGNNRIAFYSQADIDRFISPTVSFSSTSVTFTTPECARFMRFSCYTSVLDSAQLEAGSTATPYAPYVTPTTVTLPVTLRSLPDGTRDTLALSYLRPSTRAGWAWYAGSVTRNIDVYTFLEGFDAGSPVDLGGGWYRYTLYGKIKNLASSDHGLCDRTLYAIDGTIERVYAAGQAIVIRTQLATGTEVSEAFGGGHILYNCNPTTETLDPIELPVLPAPSCTIWATADATPTLTAEYVRDISAAINDMQEAIADI